MDSVTAIDVGHDSVKLVTLASRAGMPELVNVAYEPLDELGRLEAGPEKSAALRMRLSKMRASSRLRLGEAVIPVSGRTTIARYIQVPPAPPWRLDALMRFEATQQTSARIEEPSNGSRTYDYRMLDAPDVDGQMLLLLAISHEDGVTERTALARALGADDPDVDLTSIGLFNAYVHGHGLEGDEGKTVVLLDVGAGELNFCILRNGGLYFARHQPGGGRQFTDAVKQELGVTWAEAEEFKRKGAHIYTDPEEAPSEQAKAASKVLAKQASELARTVEAALMYASAQTKIRDLGIDKVLLSGGGARLSGLADCLARRLLVEVSPLEPLRKVSLGGLGPDRMALLEGKYSAFAVPLGLAVARLVPGGAKLDLRTSADKGRREFRRKGLYLWAGAAAFALGLVFWTAGAVRDRLVYADARDAARSRVDADGGEMRSLESARGENDRLHAENEALRERVTSGEDLLRALSQLKKRTPDSVRLVEVSTARPRGIGEEAPDKEITFQNRRMIYLTGYARSRESEAEAMRTVTKYRDSLSEARELFEDIRMVKLEGFESDRPGAPDIAYFILAIRIAKPR